MLDDRDYMNKDKQPALGGGQGASGGGLVVKLSCLILALFIFDVLSEGKVSELCLISADSLKTGQVWRLLTAFFLSSHHGLINFIFDLLIFYYLGGRLEEKLGPQRFRALIFNGMLGSLLGVIILFLVDWPQAIGLFGALLATMIMAYALEHYNEKIKIYFMLVIPLEITGKLILIFMLLYFGAAAVLGSWHSLLPAAGAALLAYLYVCGSFDISAFFARGASSSSAPGANTARRPIQRRRSTPPGAAAQNEGPVEDAYIREQVNPILDKIISEGLESLTEAEKEILKRVKEED